MDARLNAPTLHPRLAGRRPAADAIERSLRFIEQNYFEPLTVEQLAAVAGMSVPRFAATFRRIMGVPPYRHICQTRVRQAQALLRQGMRAVEAAAETGFFDQSHMYRHFKRVCGVTPRQYLASLQS